LPKNKSIVDCTADARAPLLRRTRHGQPSARNVTRAGLLRNAADGLTDAQIATTLDGGVATVERTRTRLVEQGVGARHERPRPGARPKLTGTPPAHMVAVACRDAPAGHPHWTMRLLAGTVVA
jgi:transposase